MKANFITITTIVITMLVLNVPVPAFSQMMDEHKVGHGQMEMGHTDKMGDMINMCIEHADKMGFTDDQIMEMKPAHREMEKKQARIKADLKIAEIELMEIMDVKDFDLDKASMAVKKYADIKTAYYLETLKAMKEMRTKLTDEQNEQNEDEDDSEDQN